MKKILIFVFILSFLLTSCSSSDVYYDNVPTLSVCQEICDEAYTDGGYSLYDAEHIAFLFGENARYKDCTVMYSTEVTDINEVGVFHCEDTDSANALAEILLEYISDMQTEQRAFIESYAPRQVPKLQNAEVRQYGNYVIYLVLSEDDKADAIEEIEEILGK